MKAECSVRQKKALIRTPCYKQLLCSRLQLFRLLVQAGAEGMAAGELARAIDIPNSSLSFHLGHLQRSGLSEQRRAGRSLIYSADYRAMDRLVAYLMENCCGGADCAPTHASEGQKEDA